MGTKDGTKFWWITLISSKKIGVYKIMRNTVSKNKIENEFNPRPRDKTLLKKDHKIPQVYPKYTPSTPQAHPKYNPSTPQVHPKYTPKYTPSTPWVHPKYTPSIIWGTYKAQFSKISKSL